jgi:hypothetical protein
MTLLFSSGCQVLMFPFQLIYYVLGTVVSAFFTLLPVAARCLPLLLLLAHVQDEELPCSTTIDDTSQMVYRQVQLQQSNTDQQLSDAQTILAQTAKDAGEHQPDTRLIVFSFDAWTSPQRIASEIAEQTRGKKVVAIDCTLVDGTHLFNDKLTFFSLLDRLKNKGIAFKAFGTMKPASDRFFANNEA